MTITLVSYLLKVCMSLYGHQVVLISRFLSLQQDISLNCRITNMGPCVCLPSSFPWYQIILLGETQRVWEIASGFYQ